MEEVISLYTQDGDPDPARPYVCFDETSKQLVAETRAPLPPRPGKPARFDYEYERQGTANVFMLVAPRLLYRHAAPTTRCILLTPWPRLTARSPSSPANTSKAPAIALSVPATPQNLVQRTVCQGRTTSTWRVGFLIDHAIGLLHATFRHFRLF